MKKVLLLCLAIMACTVNAPANAQIAPNPRECIMSGIIVLGGDWCPPCRRLRTWLNERGIQYEAYDIRANPKARDIYWLIVRQIQNEGVPMIIFPDMEVMIGFEVGYMSRKTCR